MRELQIHSIRAVDVVEINHSPEMKVCATVGAAGTNEKILTDEVGGINPEWVCPFKCPLVETHSILVTMLGKIDSDYKNVGQVHAPMIMFLTPDDEEGYTRVFPVENSSGDDIGGQVIISYSLSEKISCVHPFANPGSVHFPQQQVSRVSRFKDGLRKFAARLGAMACVQLTLDAVSQGVGFM